MTERIKLSIWITIGLLISVVWLALLLALASPANADTRFHMGIRVTTPHPGATVRVHYVARCQDDGHTIRSTGWYRATTPTSRSITPPDPTADSCTLYAHVWNLTGQGIPRLTITVTP